MNATSQGVTIYTTRFCPYCIHAKNLLASKNVTFNEIPVDGDPERRAEMMRLSGQRTVPQIWIGEQHIGGCDDLLQLDRRQQLDAMLSAL